MVVVRRIPVPARARELAELRRIDYADCFEVDVAAERAPVDWVRLAVVHLPALFAAVRVAHGALGLHLADDDADHILGWRIARSGDSEGVLTTSGRLGEPRIIGMTPPGRVVLATLVELNGLTGKALWTPTAPVHRAVAQRVLARLPAMAATAR
jgi:hypothetical protein